MKITSLTLAATLLAGGALAQTNPNTGVAPHTGVVDRNSGTAAASGNRNQAVTTTDANAHQPAHGANSFSESEARRRLERDGYSNVSGLRKDEAGVWRGTGTKNGASGQVWLDYKGNVGHGGATAASSTHTTGTGTARTAANPAARNVDGTTGNPPGTAAGRAADRALGTNTTGTNPSANAPDGTPGNPPGTAVGRAIDRTLGTNNSGANPGGNSAATPPAR